MVKFFAISTSSGRVEGFHSEAMRDEFVRRGYGRAVSRSEAKDIMLSYVLNFADVIAYDLTRKVAIAQDARATDRLFYYYEIVEQLMEQLITDCW